MSEEAPPAAAAKPAPSRAKGARPRTARVQADAAGESESPAAAAKPARASRPRTARVQADGKGDADSKPGGSKPASRARASRPRTARVQAEAKGEAESPAAAAKPARRPARPSRPLAGASQATGEAAAPPGLAGPGGEIAGYQIEAQIGEGGMAVVYRASDERLGRRVALKLLAPSTASDTEFRNRFIRESRAAAAVDHPNIIPIYEAGDAGGVLFIAMRYVQGGDAGTRLEQAGPLPARQVWDIVSQVAEALDAAHARGLIHRDVKPANMLLDAPAGGSASAAQHEHVYLSDFGISKQALSSKTLTATGQFVGTLDYIAPEQIEGHHIDGRADQYSLGCAAFELLGGEPPFRRGRGLALINAHLSEPPPSLTAQRPDLPAAVDGVLATAMAKSVDERYATCAQFAAELGRALGVLPGEARPPGPDHHPATESVQQPATLSVQQPATVPPAPVPAPAASPGPYVPPRGQQAVPPGAAWPVSPYGPYGGTPPAGPPPAPRRRSRGLRAGLITVAVAVAVAAGAAVAVLVMHHGRFSASPPPSPAPATGSPTPARSAAPPPSPRAEALAVSNLLASGGSSSTTLTYAADNVQSCTNLNRSVRQIQKVRDQRQAEYEQAQKLSTGALANGSQLKADLVQSLLDSLNADNDYLSWAQAQAASCQPGSQSGAALAADQQAVRDKTRFIQLWNVIAAQYGLAPATVGSI
ncbi:MAG TPA: serine/threonine-protein kinase [Streptosporangiaceae bacterium]